MSCPPGHLEYGCEQIARNAVQLHYLASPDCLGFIAFECGDHWHVGHRTRETGDACKATSPGRPQRV